MKRLRPVPSMLTCYFCGGRVLRIDGKARLGYRCEAEGVWWDEKENLTVLVGYRGPTPQGRDPVTGKYASQVPQGFGRPPGSVKKRWAKA